MRQLALLIAALAACGSPARVPPSPSPPATPEVPGAAAAIAPQAQDDDLAVLIPLEAATLSPQTAGIGGPLVPPALYARAFGPPGALQLGGTPAAPPLAGLRVVALRLDPCAPAATAGTPCTAQLRLVFQTVTTSGDQPTASEDAVHAFYALDRDQLLAAVRTIIALRHREAGDRALGALAPHPILVEQGGGGAFATALGALVGSLAGPRNLVRLTELTSSGMGAAWNFAGVELAGDTTTPVAIPGLPAGAPMVAFFAGFTPGELTGDPAFMPAPHHAEADELERVASRAAAAARIEDPAIHTSGTIDCASCHVARSLLTPERPVNVHMFGYHGATPSIQPRTAHETTASVAIVNALLAAR